MKFERDAWVEIDKKKLCHNFMEVRQAVGPDVKICAVLKAQCYGMGGKQTAMLFSDLGADAFAVAVLGEALELRPVVPDKEILVLGYLSPAGYDSAIKHHISLTMYQKEALLALNQRAGELGEKASVHIKVNTGMNRLGFPPTPEAAQIVAECMHLPHLHIAGIFTHLANADQRDKSSVDMQVGRFDAFLNQLKALGVTLPTVHISASPAICDLPSLDRDMVRPGLLFTGYYTSEEVRRDRIHLQPCVKLKARLGNILPVKAGEGIGYGFTYRLTKDTDVGLLPLGFSDGLTRAFSNNFFVTIRGYPCPVIGNICMDHCMIDLTAVPDPRIGEEIVVYGDGTDGPDGAMNIQQVADKRGTIVDEVLTNLSSRLPRKYV
jgi:alanine racemase